MAKNYSFVFGALMLSQSTTTSAVYSGPGSTVIGGPILTIGSEGSDSNQFNLSGDVKIFGNEVLIADALNFRMSVFDLEGNFIEHRYNMMKK